LSASPDDLASRAYRWLARRDRSRAEMRGYLRRYSDDVAEIERLLDEFEQRGYLSEARLAEQVIRSRRSRASSTRIRQELDRRGIAAEIVAESTRALESGDVDAAVSLWKKRFRVPPEDRVERERQLRFLLNRGFSHAIALRVIRIARDAHAAKEDQSDV
jgi:regulatory protein